MLCYAGEHVSVVFREFVHPMRRQCAMVPLLRRSAAQQRRSISTVPRNLEKHPLLLTATGELRQPMPSYGCAR
jgi:hypothetical protein